MTIVERLQRAIDDEPFMLGGEHDLLRDALAEVERLREENLKLRRTNEKLVSNIGGMLIRANNENERLRAALQRIAAIDTYSRRTWIMAVKAARDALKEDGR
jgi:hypothetical protein